MRLIEIGNERGVNRAPSQQFLRLRARSWTVDSKELTDPAEMVFATDLPKTACHIHTAYFVVQGQEDVITPTQAAVEYFKCVKAPRNS